MKILEESRWASGAYRGICCKVCGGLRGADAGRRAGDLDDVEGFPHREGCQAADLVRRRNIRAGLAKKAEEQLDEIREALIAAVDGNAEAGETILGTIKWLAREIEFGHADLDARGVPRTWGPNPNYRPGIPARIARFVENHSAILYKAEERLRDLDRVYDKADYQ